jgi:hypothetical protein
MSTLLSPTHIEVNFNPSLYKKVLKFRVTKTLYIKEGNGESRKANQLELQLDDLYALSEGYTIIAKKDRTVRLTGAHFILPELAEKLSKMGKDLSTSNQHVELVSRLERTAIALTNLYNQLVENAFDFTDEEADEEWKGRRFVSRAT